METTYSVFFFNEICKVNVLVQMSAGKESENPIVLKGNKISSTSYQNI